MYADKGRIGHGGYIQGGSVSTGYQLNDATFKFAVGFMVTQDITLAKVNFKTTTITGTPTGTVRIETSTAGRPSGTLAWANATKTGVTIANGWQTEITLDATGSLTRGTLYHLVITNDHGTPASNHFTVNDQGLLGHFDNGGDFCRNQTGFTASYNGSAWANRYGGIFVLVSSDGSPVYLGQPIDGVGLQTLNSSTHYGLKFTAPLTGSVVGVQLQHLPDTGAAIITAKLYNEADTLLCTGTLPTEIFTIKGITRHSDIIIFADGPGSITAGSVYRIVFLDSGSADRVEFVTAPSSPDYRTVDPIMQNWQWTSGTAGAWSDTSGKVLEGFAMIVDSVSAGAGGGARGSLLRGLVG